MSVKPVRRAWWRISLAFSAAAVALWGGLVGYERVTGTSVFVRFGGAMRVAADEHSPWLPAEVRLALHRPPPTAAPGAIAWRTAAPGFEVAELPVLSGGSEVDRIYLSRIDPALWRFEVRNDAAGRHGLDAWMRELRPALVINGSYFGTDGRPATPVVIDGAFAGPATYDARGGAFIAGAEGAGLADLRAADWRAALGGSRAAMVSYPMLIGDDGASRAPAGTGWLANRSFVAEDGAGRIVLGTTRDAFFSLDRLAAFLKASPLDLKLALDLDGGPVACQAVAVGAFRRSHCGGWELQVDRSGRAQVVAARTFGQPVMPMVLAVFPRARV